MQFSRYLTAGGDKVTHAHILLNQHVVHSVIVTLSFIHTVEIQPLQVLAPLETPVQFTCSFKQDLDTGSLEWRLTPPNGGGSISSFVPNALDAYNITGLSISGKTSQLTITGTQGNNGNFLECQALIGRQPCLSARVETTFYSK